MATYYLLVRYNTHLGYILNAPHEYSAGITSYPSVTGTSSVYKYFKSTSTKSNPTNAVVVGSTNKSSYDNVGSRFTASSTSTVVNLVDVSTFGITREGYHIDADTAYRTAASGGNVVGQNGSSAPSANRATIGKLGGSTSANKTVTIYVNWQKNTYTIHYNANGGSGTMEDTACNYGTTYNLRSNTFTRTGYTFAGWATSTGGSTSVFYVADEGPCTADHIGTNGTNIFLKDGSTFYRASVDGSNSWVNIGGNEPSGTVWAEENINIALNGDRYYFTQTYYEGSGKDTVHIYKVNSGTAVYTDGQSVSNLTSENGGEVTLYAVWTANSYTISAQAGNGQFSNNSQAVDANGWKAAALKYQTKSIPFNATYYPFPAESPTWSGYTFDGWYTAASGGTVITSSTTLQTAGNHSIYAHWRDTGPVITISGIDSKADNADAGFNYYVVDYSNITGLYTGTSNSPAASEYTTENATTISSGTWFRCKPCYFVAKDAAGNVSYVQIPVQILYANTNGGTTITSGCTGWDRQSTTSYNKWVPPNCKYKVLPEASRSGYTLDGWYTAATGGTKVTVDTVMGSSDTTIYAHWTPNKYTITANPNGGKLVGSNFGNYAGGTSTATINGTGNNGTPAAYLIYDSSNYSRLGTATRYGYLFKGWYTSTSGGTKVYDALGVYSSGTYWTSSGGYNYANNMVIYAQWQPLTYNNVSNSWYASEPYVKADNVWKPCFMDMEAINAGWAKITTSQRAQPWATIQSWVGLTNDTWSSVTACSAAAGDIVYLPCAVTDRDNLVGWFKLKVNSYSGTTLYTENQSFLFGFTYMKINGSWKLIC